MSVWDVANSWCTLAVFLAVFVVSLARSENVRGHLLRHVNTCMCAGMRTYE